MNHLAIVGLFSLESSSFLLGDKGELLESGSEMLLVMEEPIMFIMLAAMGELELGEQVELFGEEVKDIARPLPTRLEA